MGYSRYPWKVCSHMKTMLGRADQALIFAAVALENSFTRAAARLGCSKAHVSAQLTELEADLGVQLVYRTTRRITLTAAGTLYLEYASQLQALLIEAERAVSATRAEVSGRLTVTVPTSLGEVVTSELFLEFCSRHPNVELAIDMSPVHRDLTAERFDVAFRATHSLDDSLVARPIGVVRETIVASPSLLSAHEPVTVPTDLARLPCLVNSHFGDKPHWLFLRKGEGVSVTVGGPMIVNTYQGIHRLALLGVGAARLPYYMVASDLSDGRLEVVCSDWDIPALPLYVVYPGQRHLPLRTRAFIDFAVQWFQEPVRRKLFS
jgi:DNA-binding transcriptional LysR family regulator